MKKKKRFGKNTWSLHQHCVPAYIIITSVKSIVLNRDQGSATCSTIQFGWVQQTRQPFTTQTCSLDKTHYRKAPNSDLAQNSGGKSMFTNLLSK